MQETSTTVDWLCEALYLLKDHPRIARVTTQWISDTPVDMCRNRALQQSKDNGDHFAVFLDSDMAPDYRIRNTGEDIGPDNRPFLPDALDFALAHDGPCVVGVPYCCAPPHERVMVKRWVNMENDDPDPQFQIRSYERSEVFDRIGFEEVAALGTGLVSIDLRCLEVLPHPYFHYEWTDEHATAKASTEDIVFSRNLSFNGIPQYCYWSAWAGHWKAKCVNKPTDLPIKAIPRALKETWNREFNREVRDKHGERLKQIEEMNKLGVTMEDIRQAKTIYDDLRKKHALTNGVH